MCRPDSRTVPLARIHHLEPNNVQIAFCGQARCGSKSFTSSLSSIAVIPALRATSQTIPAPNRVLDKPTIKTASREISIAGTT